MSVRLYLRSYNRDPVDGRFEAGRSFIQVATAIGVTKSMVSQLKKAAEIGSAARKHAGGLLHLRRIDMSF